jgi:hypothetical protein
LDRSYDPVAILGTGRVGVKEWRNARLKGLKSQDFQRFEGLTAGGVIPKVRAFTSGAGQDNAK